MEKTNKFVYVVELMYGIEYPEDCHVFRDGMVLFCAEDLETAIKLSYQNAMLTNDVPDCSIKISIATNTENAYLEVVGTHAKTKGGNRYNSVFCEWTVLKYNITKEYLAVPYTDQPMISYLTDYKKRFTK